ncbi:MAG: ABC transporter ATP-binding protein [Myxococcales bacterium]|nr:MAG: ABC transporter ATP-binding protein [Myxococcales bacterium]
MKIKLRTGTIRTQSIRRIGIHFLPHLRRYRAKLAAAGLYMLGATLVEILRPWPLKLIFDAVLIPQPATTAWVNSLPVVAHNQNALVLAIVASMLVIAVLAGWFRYRQAYYTASVGQRVVARVRYDLYRHIQRLSHSFHDARSTGDLLARLTGDIHRLRDLLVTSALRLADQSLVLVGMFIVMMWMDQGLALVAVAVVPLLALTVVRFSGAIRGATRKQRKRESQITGTMAERISAIREVQTFAREAYEEQRFDVQNQDSMRAGLRATRLTWQLNRIVDVVLAVGTGAVLWLGVGRVRAGVLTPGDLLVFTSYLTALYKPIRRLAGLTSQLAKAQVCGDRSVSILEIEPEIRDAPDAVVAGPLRGEIAFDNVSFAYVKKAPVLRDVSFTVRPGETVAFIGGSGAGKSTIGDLLLRFYDPTNGRVLIDGVDIRQYTLASLREQISVVPQESVLFDASVMENINYGDLEATPEQIVAAAREANAHEFIEKLPDGYQTMVGERGARLSGGQRQRVAITRAMVRDTPILLLDEPMASLDLTAETKVRDALTRLVAGKACVYITHDLEAAAKADRVMLVDDGNVIELAAEDLADDARMERMLGLQTTAGEA